MKWLWTRMKRQRLKKITNVSTETDPVVRAPVKTFVEVGTQMQLN